MYIYTFMFHLLPVSQSVLKYN